MKHLRSHDGPDWGLWRSFLAVLRTGSLLGAARTLRLAHPTVRRHIKALEASVGSALFSRSPAGLVPTAAALALRPAAEAMEVAAARLAREASADAVAEAGTVRITASEIIGVEVLPPLLAELRARNPALAFELVPSDSTLDVLRRDADIAVRMTRPATGGMVARRLGAVALGFFAHRRWVEVHGEPQDLAAVMKEGALVGPDRGDALPRALAAHGIAVSREAFGFRCDSDVACLAALRAGLGVGICQAPLAARMPELQRVLPGLGAELEMWLVTHPDLRALPRVRLVLDALAAGLRRYLSASLE